MTTPASVSSNSTHLVVVDTDDDEVKTYKISDGNAAPAATFGGNGSSKADEVKEINGVKFVGQVLDGIPAKELRGLADEAKNRIGAGVSA